MVILQVEKFIKQVIFNKYKSELGLPSIFTEPFLPLRPTPSAKQQWHSVKQALRTFMALHAKKVLQATLPELYDTKSPCKTISRLTFILTLSYRGTSSMVVLASIASLPTLISIVVVVFQV